MNICKNLKLHNNTLNLETSGKIIPIDGKIYWHIDESKLTEDMDKYKIIFALERVFKTLQPYFNPIFTSTGDITQSQITMKFMVNGDPDLPELFDDNTLAYAYLANDTTSLGLISDMFFNDKFNWSEIHKPNHFNLFKVAVHEVLHALGLFHSTDIMDILFPNYQPNDLVILTLDTIEAIERLYGKVVGTSLDCIKDTIEKIFPSDRYLRRATNKQLRQMLRLLEEDNLSGFKRELMRKVNVKLGNIELSRLKDKPKLVDVLKLK